MSQNSRRGKRRGPANQSPRAAEPTTADRYQKYLPEWMRGTTPAPVRPRGPRRPRAPRPAGGYTPGKMAMGGESPLL